MNVGFDKSRVIKISWSFETNPCYFPHVGEKVRTQDIDGLDGESLDHSHLPLYPETLGFPDRTLWSR